MSSDGTTAGSFTHQLQKVPAGATGYLQVQDVDRDRRGWVFLNDGNVIAVLVDGYQPRLGRRLTASGFVSMADMADILTVVNDEYDPRIATECVTRALVDEPTMAILYREFALSAASAIDEWVLGETVWVADVPPWEGRCAPVPVSLLVGALTRRKDHWAQLWAGMPVSAIPDSVPVRIDGDRYEPETPDEVAVLGSVNGQRTLDQVAGECGFTRFQAGHVLSALILRKVLAFVNVQALELGGPATTGGYAPTHVVLPPEVFVPVIPAPAAFEPGVYISGHRPAPTVPTVPELLVPELLVPVEVHDIQLAAPAGAPDGNQASPCVPPADVEPSRPIRVETLNSPDVGALTGGADSLPVSELSLGEFFAHPVAHPAPAAAPLLVPAGAPVGAPALPAPAGLPPLPAITGGPSDFYAVLPSSRLRATSSHPTAPQPVPPALSTPAATPPVVAPSAHPEPDAFPVVLPGVQPVEEASEPDPEVARLNAELLRLTTERAAATTQAGVLRAQFAAHTVQAVTAAAGNAETLAAIISCTDATEKAHSTVNTHGRLLQHAKEVRNRAAEQKLQADQAAEQACRAVTGQQHAFDQAVADHERLQHDLVDLGANQQDTAEAVTVANDSAARSEANARHADATVTECDQLLNETRERLTELTGTEQVTSW